MLHQTPHLLINFCRFQVTSDLLMVFFNWLIFYNILCFPQVAYLFHDVSYTSWCSWGCAGHVSMTLLWTSKGWTLYPKHFWSPRSVILRVQGGAQWWHERWFYVMHIRDLNNIVRNTLLFKNPYGYIQKEPPVWCCFKNLSNNYFF